MPQTLMAQGRPTIETCPGPNIRSCGGLNRYGFHRFMCLNAWPIRSGTIRKCGLVGVGVALLEEVCKFFSLKIFFGDGDRAQ